MKALKQEQYAELLEQYIQLLDAEMLALQPSGWPVGSLQQSYAEAEAHAALGGLWHSSMQELAYQSWQAKKAQEWSEKKLAHMYI